MQPIPHFPPNNFTDLLLDAVCVVDREGYFLFVSAASERIFGYKPDEMIGQPMINFVYPGDRERTLQTVNEIINGEPKPYFENRYVRKDGKLVDIMWSARWSETDQVRVAVARDVTERKRAESMQEAVYAISEAANAPGNLNTLFQRIHDVVDALLLATNFMVALYDAEKKELTFPYSAHPFGDADSAKLMVEMIATQVIHTGRTLLLTPETLPLVLPKTVIDSYTEPLNWLIAPIRAPDGIKGALLITSAGPSGRFTEQDKELLQFISVQVAAAIERKQMLSRLEYMAQYDQLTHLPNRTLFLDRLKNSLGRAHREKTLLAVFYLDLNKFKQVNDTYGHATGDQLLYEVARRLTHSVRESDTVGRIGGDEFVVLAVNIKRHEDIGKIQTKIMSTLSVPYIFNEIQLQIYPSIGCAIYPDNGQNESELIHFADSAMYSVKKEHTLERIAGIQPEESHLYTDGFQTAMSSGYLKSER
ncbi:diguanylate cyclase domain-containing protein [Tolumonas lignilytica]|uniref:diguanylate cyclase domain-containing protein n=1 Tax=Tolumonas lignilytica TaxID=1283284 RepID=UPI00046772E4|nr:diguanylate cyclase [Tolumonas lignilytica]